MHLTSFGYLIYVTTVFLEVGVCVLALRRGLFHYLPFFTVYLVLLVAADALEWLVYHFLGMGSPDAFWMYWITQALLLVARAAVMAEVCWRVLGPYPGIWKLCRGFLIAIGGVLVASAIFAAGHSGTYIAPIVLTADRELELAIAGILIFALAFCRYYQVRIEYAVTLILLGLGLYSAVQVANNTILNQWLSAYFHWWSHVRLISFEAAALIWFLALLRPLPERRKAPLLLDREVYGELEPQVNFRLRQLNARLTEMLK